MGSVTAAQFEPSLREAFEAPEELPPADEWLAKPRDEPARAQYAYLILKKHFARIGADIEHDEVPASWWSFSRWLFCGNVERLLREGGHSAMLKELIAETVGFTQVFSGEHFTYNLFVLLENIIESQKLRDLLKPLLPPQAKIDEIMEHYWRDRDDARRRADEGYY